MASRVPFIPVFLLVVSSSFSLCAQSVSIQGQLSAWCISTTEDFPLASGGARYIPETTVQTSCGSEYEISASLSLNGSLAYSRSSGGEGRVKLYRAWARIATPRTEARIGLQKINFGSATLFRPLMWFDRIDPRDPLQLTDGVYALLARAYCSDNTNVWAWVLSGNEAAKGWEMLPSERKTPEYGGRIQIPLSTGELALSYHRRRVVVPRPLASAVAAPENRYGLDGKWDIGIGLWFETALHHLRVDIPGLTYQRLWVVGADYTIALGNGFGITAERFRADNPQTPFGSSSSLVSLWALMIGYPVSILDRVSLMIFRDDKNHHWYRLLTWQQTYDTWMMYVLLFSNPGHAALSQLRSGGLALGGTGVQFMVVFNH